ncbi:MAG: hypothetical protein KBT46_04465 [Ruminococcus sp.]|nr:hypothetical protein [Candidatus Copronaster equi]
MKKIPKRVLAILLSLVLVFSVCSVSSFATDNQDKQQVVSNEMLDETIDVLSGAFAAAKTVFAGLEKVTSTDILGKNLMKVLYNMLNILVEDLVKGYCAIYPKPSDWQDISEKDTSLFLEGRSTYNTTAKQGNYWSLGFASESLVPEDIDSGKYYLGRDLLNKKAQGVYDDMRIRVTVIDDNSGEGAIVFGAIDCLGVTSTDVRAIRKEVLEYCKEKSIKVSAIDISATHCHSALDTQGVSTEFFYKLFGNIINNKFKLFEELPGLGPATYFKQYFIRQSIKAVKEAFEDVEAGTMHYGTIDCSSFIEDKRDLVSKDNLPETVTLRFTPNSGSEETFITNVTCHPTSFSASNGVVSSDYIYYLDKYLRANSNNANVVLVQGALGQVSRDINVSDEGLDEYEAKCVQSKYLGELFGEYILKTDYSKELPPIINTKNVEIFIVPSNSILALACEVKLVNNKVYYNGDEMGIISEQGYLEFGHEVGFALFPGELYPEVFWGGSEVIGDTNWDGTTWDYPSLHNSVDGIKVYPISLCNDATGYVLTDNNFAFMGHIIGESTSDEILSVGKHQGSFLVNNYLELIEDYTK